MVLDFSSAPGAGGTALTKVTAGKGREAVLRSRGTAAAKYAGIPAEKQGLKTPVSAGPRRILNRTIEPLVFLRNFFNRVVQKLQFLNNNRLKRTLKLASGQRINNRVIEQVQ
jgi:hypothetical protein